jgi:hypothetical protein
MTFKCEGTRQQASRRTSPARGWSRNRQLDEDPQEEDPEESVDESGDANVVYCSPGLRGGFCLSVRVFAARSGGQRVKKRQPRAVQELTRTERGPGERLNWQRCFRARAIRVLERHLGAPGCAIWVENISGWLPQLATLKALHEDPRVDQWSDDSDQLIKEVEERLRELEDVAARSE